MLCVGITNTCVVRLRIFFWVKRLRIRTTHLDKNQNDQLVHIYDWQYKMLTLVICVYEHFVHLTHLPPSHFNYFGYTLLRFEGQEN